MVVETRWVGGWGDRLFALQLEAAPSPPSSSLLLPRCRMERGQRKRRDRERRGRREDALLRVRGRERPSSSSFPPPPSFILFSSSHSQCCRSPPPTSSEDPISHLDLLLVPPLPPATTTCLHTDGGQEGEGRRRYGVKRLRSPTSLGCSTV